MQVAVLSLSAIRRVPGQSLSATAALRLSRELARLGVTIETATSADIDAALAANASAIAQDQERVRTLRREARALLSQARAIERTLPDLVRAR